MYDLSLPKDREKYFLEKVGKEVAALKKYLESNSFVVYLLAKKQAGKGTYSTMLREVFGEDKIAHVSIGDIVRDAESKAKDKNMENELIDWFKTDYTGGFKVMDLMEMLREHEFSKYYPTGMIVSLLKKVIKNQQGKALLIDGFPRTIMQIENTLKFSELIDYRPDPDFFVFIECPEEVILERYKGRRVCLRCGNTSHITLNITPKIEYDRKTKEITLFCDNPACRDEKMIGKQADVKGAKYVQRRNIDTQELMDDLKKYISEESTIILRNAVPVKGFSGDEYEITKMTKIYWDKKLGKIIKKSLPWVIHDDNGVKSYSYYPAPVVKSLIKQLAQKLSLS